MAPDQKPNIQSQSTVSDEIWAGLALFCCMYYIIGLNSQILAKIGLPVSSTVLGTFLAIILFNAVGIFLTRTGLMIAPAVGISTFIVHFVVSVQHQSLTLFSWANAMLGCFLAGFLLIVTTITSDLRTKIIEEMPEPVKKGAKAAIGSLLASEAFDQYNHFTAKGGGINPSFGFWSVSLAVAAIVGFFALRSFVAPSLLSSRFDYLKVLLRLEFVLVVAAMSVALHLFQPGYVGSLPQSTELSWLWWHPSAIPFYNGSATWILTIIFVAVIWFIVITDIPGTPNEVLPADLAQKNDGRAVRLGYINDAIAAFFSPVCGTTPTIYYAENQLLKDFKAFSRIPGYTAVLLFLTTLIVIVASKPLTGHAISLEWVLPPFAVLPVLLFVGLYIVAISFTGDSAERPLLPIRTPEAYFPAAIAVVLTPEIGLEYAFPLSILSYWCAGKREGDYGPSFVWISWGAAVSLLLEIITRAG